MVPINIGQGAAMTSGTRTRAVWRARGSWRYSPRIFIVSFLTLAIHGCGGTAFEPQFDDIAEPQRSQVVDSLAVIKPREEKNVIVGVAGNPTELFAWDLQKAVKIWSKPVHALSAPIIAGPFVVLLEAKGAVARRLSDGQESFTVEGDARLLGADSDGRYTAIALEMGSRANPRGFVIGAEGEVRKWTNDLQMQVGVPAVVNGIVVVPWANQRISLLDAATGAEQMRFQMSDTIVSRAFVDRENLFLGEHGFFRFDKEIEKGSKQNLVYYEPLARPLPGQPLFLTSGYDPLPPLGNAKIKNRLIWRASVRDASIALEDDTVYFVYYRLVFALSPTEDKLNWIFMSPADIVGAAARPGHLMIVAETGQVMLLAAQSGLPVWQADTGVARLQAAAVELGNYAEKATTEDKPKPLIEQIDGALQLAEGNMAAGAAFAARYLGQLEGEQITGKIVALCADMSGSTPVRKEACKALEKRNSGARDVREALETRASFLRGISAPPAGSLARAAANMKLKVAVPDLLDHLVDPATPSGELEGVLTALGELGDKSAAPAVEEFVRLYHAETDDKILITALGTAVETLVKLQEKRALPLLKELGEDAFTAPALKKLVAQSLAEQERTPSGGVAGESKREPVEEDKRPERITGDMVQAVFQPLKQKLTKCIPGELKQVKIVMFIEPAGKIASIVTNPVEARDCIAEHLLKKSFPETRAQKKEQLVYIVYR